MKVDQGFLNNIIELFSVGEEASREQEVQLLTVWVEKCSHMNIDVYFC